MTTPEKIGELRRVVNGLVANHAEQSMRLFAGLHNVGTDPDDVRETLVQHVIPFADLAADYAAHWYHELDPGLGFAAKSDHQVQYQRVDRTMRWALFAPGGESPEQRIISTAQRMIYDGARHSVLGNAKAEGATWFRHAPTTACRFCRVLTVNPDAYHSERAIMPVHDDDCECLAVPARPGHKYRHPGYVTDWVAEYRAANTGDFRSTIRRMDRNSV